MARWWMGVALVGLGLGVARGQQLPPTNPQGDSGVIPVSFPAFAPQPPPKPGPHEVDDPTCDPTGQKQYVEIPPEECDPSCRLYGRTEYLQWWIRKSMIPPLVTAGQIEDLIPGALGQFNTVPLITRTIDNDNDHIGVRGTVGYWLDSIQSIGVEASFFVLEQRSNPMVLGSTGSPDSLLLARPFINVVANQEDADPLTVPSVMGGAITLQVPRRFFGGEANVRFASPPSIFGVTRLSFLFGGRYLNLDEKLLIGESLIDLPGAGAAGNTYNLNENFTTYNRFYGGQFGIEAENRFGDLVISIGGKLGLGNNEQLVRVSGSTQITEANGTVSTANDRALLIQPSNAGRFRREEFSFVPELNVNVAYEFNQWVRINAGYTFLYWSDVLRPGDQIDRAVNIQPIQPNAMVGPARPTMQFRNTDFWAQGFSVGLQLNY